MDREILLMGVGTRRANANYSEARKRELLLKKQKGGLGFYTLTRLDPAQFQKTPTLSGA